MGISRKSVIWISWPEQNPFAAKIICGDAIRFSVGKAGKAARERYAGYGSAVDGVDGVPGFGRRRYPDDKIFVNIQFLRMNKRTVDIKKKFCRDSNWQIASLFQNWSRTILLHI